MTTSGLACPMTTGAEVEAVSGEGFCRVLPSSIRTVGVMVNMLDSALFGKVFSVLFANV